MWRYGGTAVYVGKHAHTSSTSAFIFGLLLLVAMPITAACWALAHWWPVSGAVWVGTACAFWVLAVATAADEC